MTVLRDSALLEERQRAAAVAYARAAAGLSSSLWVVCPRCSIGRGDPCTGGDTHDERHRTNAERLLRLPTWGVGFSTPCCRRVVWLVWRTAADELQWSGIPCFGCGATFEARLHASDLIAKRVPMARLHPDRVEVLCWASEESPDDNGTAAGSARS